MAPVTCDVQVEFSSPYYGRLILSKIRNEDNTPVTINSFLGLAFKSPAQVDKPYFTVSLTPWQAVTAMVTNEPVKSSLYTVLAGLHLESPHTFNTNDTITIDINGDLNADAETYVKSFVLAADKMPDTNGKQKVTLTEGKRVITAHMVPGEKRIVVAPAGNYAVAASELATVDETYVATAYATPSSLVVEAGKTVSLSVAYGDLKE